MKNDVKTSNTNDRSVLETLQDSMEGNESDGQEKSVERENETLQGADGGTSQESVEEIQDNDKAKLAFDEAMNR